MDNEETTARLLERHRFVADREHLARIAHHERIRIERLLDVRASQGDREASDYLSLWREQ